MFLVKFCCANRDEDDAESGSVLNQIDLNSAKAVQKKLRLAKNVLVEFL